MPNPPSFDNKALILRYTTLGRLPPAMYATELMNKAALSCLVVEFGVSAGSDSTTQTPVERWRIGHRWCRYFPARLAPAIRLVEAFYRLLCAGLRGGRPVVIVSHGLQEQVLGGVLGFFWRIPHVVHAHEVFEAGELTWFNRLLFFLEGPVLRKAAFTVFPERRRRELYEARYRLTCPTEVAPNCPPKRGPGPRRNLRMELGLGEDTFLLGYMGGVGNANAPDLVIDALPAIAGVHFLIWGWGEPQFISSLKERAAALKVGERVHFLGEAGQEKWASLAGLDAAYCVYRPQSLRLRFAATASNKLFEALAVGVPVITGTGEDFREFLKQHPVGLALESLSPTALVRALEFLIAHPEQRKAMGESGRQVHQGHFHFEKAFQPVLERYQRIWESHSPRVFS